MGAEPGSSKIYENKHDEVNYFITRKQAAGRSERTLNSYSRVLRKFFHDQFPELSPDEVEVRHVEDYLMALTKRGVSQNSKKKYLEVLSSFYGYTLKRPQFEGITSNPAAIVLEEISRIRPDRPDCATWENACKLILCIWWASAFTLSVDVFILLFYDKREK